METLEKKVKEYLHPHEFHSKIQDGRTLGERWADTASKFVGSWTFIVVYCIFTLLWVVVNTLTPLKFDPYSFIFYTFCVSVMAILFSSLILLAGNRTADIDRQHAENAFGHVDDINSKQDQQIAILNQQTKSGLDQHAQILDELKEIKKTLGQT